MSAVLIELAGLTKSFGRRRVIDGVSLALAARETVGLIGPNGAGKTTLLRIVAGLIRPNQGHVHSSVSRNDLVYFAGGHTIPPGIRASRWASLVSSGEFKVENDRRAGVLSRGSKQILGLRTVLAIRDARVILLDEPWEGLDPDGARWLSETIRFRQAEGCTFLLSSHRLFDLAGVCDRYSFLIDGKLMTSSAVELRRNGPVTGEDLMAAFDRLRASG